MIRVSERKVITTDIYCEHTQPSYFFTLKPGQRLREESEEIKIDDRDISGGFAFQFLRLLLKVVQLSIPVLNSIANLLLGQRLATIERSVEESVNDYRCDNCKKERLITANNHHS
jgi:hypothetical protein